MSSGYTYKFNIEQYQRIASQIRKELSGEAVQVFEIGSRDAADAFLLLTLLEKGSQVVCFDPHPMFTVLAAPFAAATNSLNLENIALGATEGPCSFFMTNVKALETVCDDFGIGASSLKQPVANVPGLPTVGFERTEIQCRRADSYCEEHGLLPDVLIMDVQGAEEEVLQSFGERLECVGLIFCECNIRSGVMYEGDVSVTSVTNYLRQRGFKLVDAYNISKYSADLVFVNARRLRARPGVRAAAVLKLFFVSRMKQLLGRLRSLAG